MYDSTAVHRPRGPSRRARAPVARRMVGHVVRLYERNGARARHHSLELAHHVRRHRDLAAQIAAGGDPEDGEAVTGVYSNPDGSIQILRDIPNGASYWISEAVPGITAITICDVLLDAASIELDQAAARQLIKDLEMVAQPHSTVPTPNAGPAMAADRALALAGLVQIVFQRLGELDRVDPVGASNIVAAMSAELGRMGP